MSFLNKVKFVIVLDAFWDIVLCFTQLNSYFNILNCPRFSSFFSCCIDKNIPKRKNSAKYPKIIVSLKAFTTVFEVLNNAEESHRSTFSFFLNVLTGNWKRMGQ